MIEKISISIWERDFEIPINYNCYKGETVTDEQIQVLKEFLEHPEWLAKSKKAVENYCRQDVLNDPDNKKKDNVFSYLKPISLFVKHSKTPRIALMCNYRYDEEHGVAIVFERDGKISIGIQDIIL